ncbi:MAG: hypothetical protein ACAI43_17145 [Phycisphaerae bacterium]|nr:hypothetical protein [Tepidisphaeraceae bacterium]
MSALPAHSRRRSTRVVVRALGLAAALGVVATILAVWVAARSRATAKRDSAEPTIAAAAVAVTGGTLLACHVRPGPSDLFGGPAVHLDGICESDDGSCADVVLSAPAPADAPEAVDDLSVVGCRLTRGP